MLSNIFQNPEVLDKKAHKDLKISPYKDYAFAKDAYLVPISIEEMLVATKSLIIVFIRDERGDMYPSVVLGGEESKNLLLEDDSTWKKNMYIPAALRAYPFGIGASADNTFITVDPKADVFKEKNGTLLVKDEENLSEHGENAVKFVTEVYTKINQAKVFAKTLDELSILKQAELTITKGEDEYHLKSGVYIVDENALNKLESRKLKKLATSGSMGFIYAHLLSLRNRY